MIQKWRRATHCLNEIHQLIWNYVVICDLQQMAHNIVFSLPLKCSWNPLWYCRRNGLGIGMAIVKNMVVVSLVYVGVRQKAVLSVTIYYCGVIMDAMASQITTLRIVYSTIHSGADQRNIKAPRHWPLCEEFTGARLFAAARAQQKSGRLQQVWTFNGNVKVKTLTGVVKGIRFINDINGCLTT